MDEWLLDITGLLFDPPLVLQFFFGFLAAWRLAFALIFDAGPFGVFIKVRERVGIQHDDDGRPQSSPEGFPASLFRCVLCMTFWTTPVVYAILWAVPPLVVLIATWAAASLVESFRVGRS